AEAAGRSDAAVTYYGLAGEGAQARSAHEEAIGHLRKAIALIGALPADRERDVREVGVQLVLGASLMAVRGYAHAETEAAYERARLLCDAVGHRRQLASALAHLSACYFNRRGFLAHGLEMAERSLEVAQQTREDVDLVLAHGQMLVVHYYQGKFASSLAHA